MVKLSYKYLNLWIFPCKIEIGCGGWDFKTLLVLFQTLDTTASDEDTQMKSERKLKVLDFGVQILDGEYFQWWEMLQKMKLCMLKIVVVLFLTVFI